MSRVPCILLADDDPSVLSVAAKVLRLFGYTVLEAAGGSEAFELYQQHAAQIDLLLTDVVMPELTGPELADRLRAVAPELPVVFMSGFTGGAIEAAQAFSDNSFFIDKPFTVESLLAGVQRFVPAPDKS